MRKIVVILFACLIAYVSSAYAVGYLENPQNDSFESGITAITGWHCNAKVISFTIDGQNIGNAGIGTPRLDTALVCDGNINSGFSYLLNYSNLQTGPHTVKAFADGVQFGQATFTVVRIQQQTFLTGAPTIPVVIPNFPGAGQAVTLQWSQAKQNFAIVASGANPPSGTGEIVACINSLPSSQLPCTLGPVTILSLGQSSFGTTCFLTLSVTASTVNGSTSHRPSITFNAQSATVNAAVIFQTYYVGGGAGATSTASQQLGSSCDKFNFTLNLPQSVPG